MIGNVFREYRVIVGLVLLLCSSCGRFGGRESAHYTVSLTDFEDVLSVSGVVESLRSITLTCPQQVNGAIIRLVEDGTTVQVGDTVCVLEDQNLQNRYDELTVGLENAEANLEKVKADLASEYALLEAQVRSNEAEAEIAGLDSLQMKYSTPNQQRIKRLELEKNEIERKRYKKKLDALKVIQQSEIRKLELEVQRMRNQLESTENIMKRLVITAPVCGVATLPMSWITGKETAVGDNVWSNVPLVVIPELGEMKVKILAPERDFKSMNVGDSVRYTFDALPGCVAWGKITKKMPVGKPVTRDSKVKAFEVEASIDSVTGMPEPGFTADCRVMLQSEKQTVVVPQVALFDEDSMKVVYVRLKRGYEKRQVSTGRSSQKETVIVAGLEVKESIALIKPSAASVKSVRLLADSIQTIHN